MNAYIHIPFCTSICNYCDFTSFAGQEGKMPAYVKAVCDEITSSSLMGPLKTVYFGGGTPSLLLPQRLEEILKALKSKVDFSRDAEISMEANPETVDRERLQSYRELGINRLSFGAQAFQKQILKKLGRGHDWQRVEEAFVDARQAGFENINLDLMFGLSGQTFSMFQESLQKAVNLNPEHLSLYALQVEKGTPLAQQVAEGLPLPGEDELANEYAWAQVFLSQQGFEQYEVSNFSKPGKVCRHNWNIWRQEDYWGFGLSAVGTLKNIRYSHGDDLIEYIAQMPIGEYVLAQEPLSKEVRDWEKLMLGLRTREGISKEQADRFLNSSAYLKNSKFNRLLIEGYLSLNDGRYRVSSKGYFVLNGILETFAA